MTRFIPSFSLPRREKLIKLSFADLDLNHHQEILEIKPNRFSIIGPRIGNPTALLVYGLLIYFGSSISTIFNYIAKSHIVNRHVPKSTIDNPFTNSICIIIPIFSLSTPTTTSLTIASPNHQKLSYRSFTILVVVVVTPAVPDSIANYRR